MGLDLTLGDRIAAKGVPVEYQPGWQNRSAGSFDSDGALLHHTAGSPNGRAPSLSICTYGRSDLPGPLCQALQTREADGWDHAIVIAAGRANHAGSGGWNGLTGNSRVHGLEVEHTGLGAVAYNRLEVSARIIAAMLEAPGSTGNAAYACQHKEWAPTRKIDFYNLAPHFNNDTFRQRVAYWIGRTIHGGGGTVPKNQQEYEMFACQAPGRPWVVCSFTGVVHMYGGEAVPFVAPGDEIRPNLEYWGMAKAHAFATNSDGSPPVLDAGEWDNAVAAARQARVTLGKIVDLALEDQTNVQRIVWADTNPDKVYITDGIEKSVIDGWDNVNISWYADFAEYDRENNAPFAVPRAWLDQIPLAGVAPTPPPPEDPPEDPPA
jgi:hypothetical protein